MRDYTPRTDAELYDFSEEEMEYMRRQGIYKEIEKERAYQQERWGDKTDDTVNTPWMWASYIAAYATKWMAGTFAPLKREVTDDFRAKMVKAAAIAVAAVESVDRQREANGATFYENEQ